MNMKVHILAALSEELSHWEELLASLNDEQLTGPYFDLDWSIKDLINHLWGWQQISAARLNAAVLDREPEYPNWLTSYSGNWDEDSNQTNSWIFKNFHNQSWAESNKNWREGYLRLLDLGRKVSERDLLDGDRYLWLKGYSLSDILVASYAHHQEHLEELIDWLKSQGNKE
jgi:hypothetical protein